MPEQLQLRRAASVFAYWRQGQFFFHNFATRQTIASSPITCAVLDFFSKWRTSEEAVTHFANYSAKSVRAAVSRLVENGLLLVKNSPAAIQDNRITKEWDSWLPAASFHFSTKNASYLVDGHANVEQLKRTLGKPPQPRLFKTLPGAKKISLPRSTLPDSEFIRVLLGRKTHRRFSSEEITLETVAHLLSLVWGVTGYLHSPVFGKLLHKTSPSAGARHPGEVYLMALGLKDLRAGLYHYHPSHHHLETMSTGATRDRAWRYCARQDFARNAAALFLMTAVFPRTMWKYRHPRAYRVVLLDAGHLCQTFCLVATWLGLAPFCTAALKDTFIEDDLGIDGVRESILYVAGVGVPAAERQSDR